MKKILVFAEWFPPAYKAGGPVRSCSNFAFQMASDYEVYVWTSAYDLGESKPLEGITMNRWVKLTDGLHVFFAGNDLPFPKALVQVFKELNPDYAYLNSMFSTRYTVLPIIIHRYLRHPSVVVWSPRGMLKDSALAFKPFKKKLFLALLGFSRIPRKVRFHATDQQEMKDVRMHFGETEVYLAPNFPAMIDVGGNAPVKQPGELKVAFVGRIHPIKQLDFALKSLVGINGNIILSIIGNIEDQEYWENCKRIIGELPENVQVGFEGPLEHELLLKKLQEQHLFLLPTKGENFGHSIYESLMSGIPVLISDQTPWRDLYPNRAGWDLPLDKEEQFKEAIEEALTWDHSTWELWSASSMAFVLGKTDLPAIKKAYQAIFKS